MDRRPWASPGRHLRLGALVVGSTLAIGCGDNGDMGAGPDGGVDASSAIDATDPDAPNGDLSCSIKAGAAGLTAVLHAADGSVQATRMTDATGTASWDTCPANAMMSFAVLDLAAGHRGVTVAGVQPGDHLEVRLADVGLLTIAAVDVPEDNGDVALVRVHAGAQCMANAIEGETEQLSVGRSCAGDDPTKLSILATGRIDGVNVYAFQTDVTVGAGVSTTVDAMSNWMTGSQLTASATNIATPSASFSIQPMRDGKPYGGLTQGAIVADNAASVPLATPPSGFTTTKRVGMAVSTNLASQGIVRMSADPLASFAFDASTLLPAITALAVDDTTPARPIYTVTGSLTATDLGIIRSTWFANASEVTWEIIFPSASQSTFTFPALPGELSSVTPAEVGASSVAAIDITDASYAQILTRGYGISEYVHYCAELSLTSECWFTSLQTP